MLGMIMFHIIMVGILGIKKSIGAPIFVLILLAFDFVFWCARAEAVCASPGADNGRGVCSWACRCGRAPPGRTADRGDP
jgi:hypothetical protein